MIAHFPGLAQALQLNVAMLILRRSKGRPKYELNYVNSLITTLCTKPRNSVNLNHLFYFIQNIRLRPAGLAPVL